MRMVPNLKTALLSTLALAGVVGCDPEKKPTPEPPKPEPVIVESDVNDGSQLASILTTKEKNNTSYKFIVRDNFERTTDNMRIVGDIKKFDTDRKDIEVEWGDWGMYLPDGTVISHYQWEEDSDAHKIVANENGNWPQTIDQDNEDLFAKSGYTQILRKVYEILIKVTAEDAADLDFIKRIVEENKGHSIELDRQGHELSVWAEDLLMFNTVNIQTGGPISCNDVVFDEIRVINDSLSLGCGPGTNRLMDFVCESILNGGEPSIQATPSWANTRPHPHLIISQEYLSEANQIEEYAQGNQSMSNSPKRKFYVLGKSFLIRELYFTIINEYGQDTKDRLPFSTSLDYGYAGWQDPWLAERLIQNNPLGDIDALENGNAAQEWFVRMGFATHDFPENYRKKNVVVVTPREWENKYYGEFTPAEAPSWMIAAMEIREERMRAEGLLPD